MKRYAWGLAGFALLVLAGGEARAAYDCFVTVTGTGVIYDSSSAVDAGGSVTLTCSRAIDDANTLTYRIKADSGLNASGTQRRVRRGASADTLEYELSHGACTNNSNWEAPATGSGRVITGTLSFGAALTASTTSVYCIRLPAQGTPSAGVYTDTVGIFAQYPDSNAGALTVPALLNYTVGASDECVFETYPTTLIFHYTSFSPAPQVASQAFVLRCSSKLPWSVSVDPPASTMLGLDYSIAASPAAGTGLGNVGQTVTLTGTLPAGQAGSCARGTCTATRPHTVIISY